MNFPFRRPPRAYAADAADTPFARAQQAWDMRMGSAVQAAITWRWLAFGLGAHRLGLLADCGKKTPFLDRIVITVEREGDKAAPSEPQAAGTQAASAATLMRR